jgi:hypothetical protein
MRYVIEYCARYSVEADSPEEAMGKFEEAGPETDTAVLTTEEVTITDPQRAD